MDIKLDKIQRESVEFNAGDLLVKGVPGSGKSVVLMQRALRFNNKANKENKSVKILIAVFTRSLSEYTDNIIKSAGILPNLITVTTIDSIAFNLYRRLRKPGRVVFMENDVKKSIIVQALQNHYTLSKKKHRFYDLDPEFWAEEFTWIKQKNIANAEQYINSDRSGRGGKIRMTKADKQIAYELFAEYKKIQEQRRILETEDYYQYLLKNEDKIKDFDKYDYVLVDEAQDLSFVQLRFAKIIATRSLTIAADAAQKIYDTSFSWKELGIDIRGRSSKTLERSFRSTKQIVELATSLIDVNRKLYGDLAEYTDPIIPDRNGAVPIVVNSKDSAGEEYFVISTIKGKEMDDPDQTIGVLYRSYKEGVEIARWLRNANVYYEVISKKTKWSMETPGVKLSTLHSAKGLEFDSIIIPKFNSTVFPLSKILDGADDEQIIELEAKERSLVYVGMTRAKYDLLLTFSGTPSIYLYDFKPQFYQYMSSEGALLKKPVRNFSGKNFPANDGNRAGGIKNGYTVVAHINGYTKTKKFSIDTVNSPEHKAFIGKHAGDSVTIGGINYIIGIVIP